MGKINFGPAGNPISFTGETIKVPFFIKEIGLDAYEYQATYGVRINKQNAINLGKNADKNGIRLSMHAPYYINLSSPKEDVLERSVQRLIQAARASEWMGARRIVFHPGFYTKYSKQDALNLCKKTIKVLQEELSSLGINNYTFAPETTGKRSQLGSLGEIIDICQTFDHFAPTIDFAHVHARNFGCIKNKSNYQEIFQRLEDNLSINMLHCHFTHIEFGNSGERKHHILGTEYGPPLEPLLETIMENGWDVTIICETPLLEKDALKMKSLYNQLSH